MLIKERTIWTPDNCFLLEYKERCEAGEFIIGQELWRELCNLADDLKNDRYEYDRYAALLRMDFMEHCVRLTKSPYYNKPMVLMLWQKAFIEAAYSFKMAQESKVATLHVLHSMCISYFEYPPNSVTLHLVISSPPTPCFLLNN